MEKLTREKALEEHGEEIVDRAVSYYEKNAEGDFWEDISVQEQLYFINVATIYDIIWHQEHNMRV